jgi:hypothetical protein
MTARLSGSTRLRLRLSSVECPALSSSALSSLPKGTSKGFDRELSRTARRSPTSVKSQWPLHPPRSGALAATLSGGLRPGSLRVHDPCKQEGEGSRLGFPGRRQPRGPAAPGNVARDLQVLPQQAGCLRKGEGRWAWTRRNFHARWQSERHQPGRHRYNLRLRVGAVSRIATPGADELAMDLQHVSPADVANIDILLGCHRNELIPLSRRVQGQPFGHPHLRCALRTTFGADRKSVSAFLKPCSPRRAPLD